MKRFAYFKNLWVVVLLPFLVSGCLKSKDNPFDYNVDIYVLQKNSESIASTEAKFGLYVGIYNPIGDLVSAEVNGPTSLNMVKTGINAYETKMTDSEFSTDIPQGVYRITAANSEGQTAFHNPSIRIDKQLGNLIVEEFVYNSQTNTVKARWLPVENANAYYLMYSIQSSQNNYYRINNRYVYWHDRDQQGITQGEICLDGLELIVGTPLKLAIVAGYEGDQGTLMLESTPLYIKIKTQEEPSIPE